MPDDNSCMCKLYPTTSLLQPSLTRPQSRHSAAPSAWRTRPESSEPGGRVHPRAPRRVPQSDPRPSRRSTRPACARWTRGVAPSSCRSLSNIYNLEISSIDVKVWVFPPLFRPTGSRPTRHRRHILTHHPKQSLRIDRFGEGSNRVIIVYSGIHYDRIAFSMDLSYPVEVDVTRWADDEAVLDKATQPGPPPAGAALLHGYDRFRHQVRGVPLDWAGDAGRGEA